jgi:hypothetical protein
VHLFIPLHVPPFWQLGLHVKSEHVAPVKPVVQEQIFVPVHVPPFKQIGLQVNLISHEEP